MPHGNLGSNGPESQQPFDSLYLGEMTPIHPTGHPGKASPADPKLSSAHRLPEEAVSIPSIVQKELNMEKPMFTGKVVYKKGSRTVIKDSPLLLLNRSL